MIILYASLNKWMTCDQKENLFAFIPVNRVFIVYCHSYSA
jgi:hypothetical protein